jgi:hypothetical protein
MVIRKKVAVGAGSSVVVHALLQRHNTASELIRAPERSLLLEGIEGGRHALAHGNNPSIEPTSYCAARLHR